MNVQMLLDYISSLDSETAEQIIEKFEQAKADSADSWMLDSDCWRTNDDDLISRAAAIDAIGDLIKEYRDNGKDEMADGMIIVRRYGIRRLPAVDAVPVVHGRWSEKRWMTDDDWGVINHRAIVCSACKREIADGEQTCYCPNCGAKMDGERRDSE